MAASDFVLLSKAIEKSKERLVAFIFGGSLQSRMGRFYLHLIKIVVSPPLIAVRQTLDGLCESHRYKR